MPRDYRASLQDVLDAIADVQEFVGAMGIEEFKLDKKTLHAVVRLDLICFEYVTG